MDRLWFYSFEEKIPSEQIFKATAGEKNEVRKWGRRRRKVEYARIDIKVSAESLRRFGRLAA